MFRGVPKVPTVITDALLQGMTAQVANMAKTEMRYHHQLNGILAIYQEGEGLHRMRKVERLIEEYEGKAWLNSGRAKDIVFGVLSLAGGSTGLPTGVAAPDAIVIATAGDRFEPTAALLALPPEEQDRIMRTTLPREAPEYFQPHDVLMVLAQTAERVCVRTQRLRMPGALLVGEPEIRCGPQEGFDGRLKLYGVAPPVEVMETLKRAKMTN